MIKLIVLSTALIILAGCSSIPEAKKEALNEKAIQEEEQQKQEEVQPVTVKDNRDPIADDPYYAPIEPAQKPTSIAVTGSLFNSEQAQSLYSYSAPYQIGDSITVILQEDASASKSASSTLANTDSYTLDPITIPGGELKINDNVVELGLNKESGFDGSSGADQKHSISARITVSIVNILNNGNLQVRGEKWLVINNGNEYMRFTGTVRPLDVSEDNTVESAQVANTRIEFSATGAHQEAQKKGWLSSLLGNAL